MWTAALLALQAALLRALRTGENGAWWLFALLVAIALYVDPLTFLALGGLALYVAVTRRGERRTLLRGALALAAGTLPFVPWLIFLTRDLGAIEHSLATTLHTQITPLQVTRAFLSALRLNFADLNWVGASPGAIVATGIVLVLLAFAFAGVIRGEPRRVWLFLVLPLLATTLPFLPISSTVAKAYATSGTSSQHTSTWTSV